MMRMMFDDFIKDHISEILEIQIYFYPSNGL